MLGVILTLACSSELDNKPRARIGDDVSTNSKEQIGEAKWNLQPNSKVEWVGSKVSLDHQGGFERTQGFVVVNNGNLIELMAEFEVASLFSDHPKLTKHLLEPDFFDVEAFPKSSFVMKSYTSSKDTGEMIGVLTLKGVSKSIVFPAQVSIEASKALVVAEFTINRKEFNMNYAGRANDLIRDDVLIKVQMHYSAQ